MKRESVIQIMKVTITGVLLVMTACAPPVTPAPSEAAPPTGPATATLPPAATGSISGRVWHDECAVSEGAGALNPGCVQDASGVHADGLPAASEQPIGGVRVSLGSGACPSRGLAETTTSPTDPSYSFGGLSAGTYCVSIDPAQEQNRPILLPGRWTYPSLADGAAGATVTLQAGEDKFDVSFGWDHQFLPAAAQAAATSTSAPVASGCQDAAQYIRDDGLDGTSYAPNVAFTKTWTLKNTGTCTWDSSYLVHYLSGATMTQDAGYPIVPRGQTVTPGQTVDIGVGMTSPPEGGSYQSYWGLKKVNGSFLPVRGGANGNSFYLKIRVDEGTAAGNITDASIAIEREEGSGPACTAEATYFVYVSISADGPATAHYEINSTAGQVPAGNFQVANDPGLYPVVNGSLAFERADTQRFALHFVGPYPDPADITVNLQVNGGSWYSARLACP